MPYEVSLRVPRGLDAELVATASRDTRVANVLFTRGEDTHNYVTITFTDRQEDLEHALPSRQYTLPLVQSDILYARNDDEGETFPSEQARQAYVNLTPEYLARLAINQNIFREMVAYYLHSHNGWEWFNGIFPLDTYRVVSPPRGQVHAGSFWWGVLQWSAARETGFPGTVEGASDQVPTAPPTHIRGGEFFASLGGAILSDAARTGLHGAWQRLREGVQRRLGLTPSNTPPPWLDEGVRIDYDVGLIEGVDLELQVLDPSFRPGHFSCTHIKSGETWEFPYTALDPKTFQGLPVLIRHWANKERVPRHSLLPFKDL